MNANPKIDLKRAQTDAVAVIPSLTLLAERYAKAWEGGAASAALTVISNLSQGIDQLAPADPWDWPLPCDVKVGTHTITQGCKLRTLLFATEVLYRLSMEKAAIPANTKEVLKRFNLYLDLLWLKNSLNVAPDDLTLENLHAENTALKSEVAHWKSNHADIVKRKALLEERPDLPVDRIPAYREVERLQAENAALKAAQQTEVQNGKAKTV